MEAAARSLIRQLEISNIPARYYGNVGVFEIIEPELHEEDAHKRQFIDFNDFHAAGFIAGRARKHFNVLIVRAENGNVYYFNIVANGKFVSMNNIEFAFINAQVERPNFNKGYGVPNFTAFTSIAYNPDNNREIISFYDAGFNEIVAGRQTIDPADVYEILPRMAIDKIGNLCVIGNDYVNGIDLNYAPDGGNNWVHANGINYAFIKYEHTGNKYLRGEYSSIPMAELNDLIVMPDLATGLYNGMVIDDKKYECVYNHKDMYFTWDKNIKSYVLLKTTYRCVRTKAALRSDD